jgi:uncharacterized protein YciI/uncharacterized protein YndB with AHSA1/START domain
MWPDPAPTDDLTTTKSRTDRTIELDIVVNAPAADVFDLWISENGVKSFFAPGARIEPRVGGAYEIMFDPQNDPTGEQFGTRGARLLAMERGRRLAFEWRGKPGMDALRREPLPTWVELIFSPANDDAGKTKVTLRHFGFGQGAEWDEGFEYFGEKAWPHVLRQLQLHFAPAAHADASEQPLYYAVIVRRGPNWKPIAEWSEAEFNGHRELMVQLNEAGRIVMAGPFTDNEGGLTILRADSIDHARATAANDPLVKSGVLALDVHPWRVVMREKTGK